LLAKLRGAEAAWRESLADWAKAKARSGSLSDGADGRDSIHPAAMNERVAFHRFRRALKAFADLVLRDRPPVSAAPEAESPLSFLG